MDRHDFYNALTGRLSDQDLYNALDAAMGEMGDIECSPETRAALTKIIEELAERIQEQAAARIGDG